MTQEEADEVLGCVLDKDTYDETQFGKQIFLQVKDETYPALLRHRIYDYGKHTIIRFHNLQDAEKCLEQIRDEMVEVYGYPVNWEMSDRDKTEGDKDERDMRNISWYMSPDDVKCTVLNLSINDHEESVLYKSVTISIMYVIQGDES